MNTMNGTELPETVMEALQTTGLLNEMGILQKATCSKTGQPLGFLLVTNEQMHAMKELLPSMARLQYALGAYALRHVSPCWLVVDNSTLDKLFVNDPLGYFIYACSKLFAKFDHPEASKFVHERSVEGNYKFHVKLAIAYERAKGFDVEQVIACNEQMRRVLAVSSSIFDHPKLCKVSCQSMLNADLAELTTQLEETLHAILRKEYGHKHPANLSWHDVLTLMNKFRGNRLFAAQRAHGGNTIDQLAWDLRGLQTALSRAKIRYNPDALDDIISEIHSKKKEVKAEKAVSQFTFKTSGFVAKSKLSFSGNY